MQFGVVVLMWSPNSRPQLLFSAQSLLALSSSHWCHRSQLLLGTSKMSLSVGSGMPSSSTCTRHLFVPFWTINSK